MVESLTSHEGWRQRFLDKEKELEMLAARNGNESQGQSGVKASNGKDVERFTELLKGLNSTLVEVDSARSKEL